MKTRIKTGALIFLAVALAVAAKFLPLNIGEYVFDVFALFISFFACVEMSNILDKTGKENNKYIIAVFPIFMYAVLLITQHMVDFPALLFIEFLSFAFYFLVDLLIENISNKSLTGKENFKLAINNLLGFIYPGLLIVCLLNLNHLDYYAMGGTKLSIIFIILAFLSSMLTDTFAYFVGSLLHGPKLAPKISPNKTISGAVGGLIGGFVAGIIVYYFASLLPALKETISAYGLLWWQFALVGLGSAVIGQAGDLLESKFKRMANIKDSGSLFPGHGGMLDRVDNFMVNTVYLFIVSIIIIL